MITQIVYFAVIRLYVNKKLVKKTVYMVNVMMELVFVRMIILENGVMNIKHVLMTMIANTGDVQNMMLTSNIVTVIEVGGVRIVM
jgi:hypothetical protein